MQWLKTHFFENRSQSGKIQKPKTHFHVDRKTSTYSPCSRVWVTAAVRPHYRSTQTILVSLHSPFSSSSSCFRILLLLSVCKQRASFMHMLRLLFSVFGEFQVPPRGLECELQCFESFSVDLCGCKYSWNDAKEDGGKKIVLVRVDKALFKECTSCRRAWRKFLQKLTRGAEGRIHGGERSSGRRHKVGSSGSNHRNSSRHRGSAGPKELQTEPNVGHLTWHTTV